MLVRAQSHRERKTPHDKDNLSFLLTLFSLCSETVKQAVNQPVSLPAVHTVKDDGSQLCWTNRGFTRTLQKECSNFCCDSMSQNALFLKKINNDAT